jgi:hypothetical protein
MVVGGDGNHEYMSSTANTFAHNGVISVSFRLGLSRRF